MLQRLTDRSTRRTQRYLPALLQAHAALSGLTAPPSAWHCTWPLGQRLPPPPPPASSRQASGAGGAAPRCRWRRLPGSRPGAPPTPRPARPPWCPGAGAAPAASVGRAGQASKWGRGKGSRASCLRRSKWQRQRQWQQQPTCSSCGSVMACRRPMSRPPTVMPMRTPAGGSGRVSRSSCWPTNAGAAGAAPGGSVAPSPAPSASGSGVYGLPPAGRPPAGKPPPPAAGRPPVPSGRGV